MMSDVRVTCRTRWCVVLAVVVMAVTTEVLGLNGSNMCMVKQKYNITKRVKYRAPMAVRTYEWCFAVPPRCSKWTTEMRDLTKLETEERTADVAVCCPGYKMQDGSCVTICPFGKTGLKCADGCPEKKWGLNCVNDCKDCEHGVCSPKTGKCQCQHGWQGERCETIIPTTTPAVMEELLTNKSTPALSAELPTKTTTSASTTSRLLTSTFRTLSTKSTTETIAAKPSSLHTTEKYTTPVITSTENLETTTQMRTAPTVLTTTPATTKLIPITMNNTNTSQIGPTQTTVKPVIVTSESTSTPISGKPNLVTVPNNEENTNKYSEVLHQYNRTETPTITTMEVTKKAVKLNKINEKTTTMTYQTKPMKATEKLKIVTTKENFSIKQSTKRPESTISTASTIKSKPKEIWIRPAQKGESTIVEIKTKQSIESSQHRLRTTNKKEPSTMTTPRTIIVSIIPTSVSYSSFKKIALSTTSYVPVRHQFSQKSNNKSTDAVITKFTPPTTTSTTVTKEMSTTLSSWSNHSTINHVKSPTNKAITNAPPTKESHLKTTKLLSIRNNTNSMQKVVNAVDKISKLTTVSSIANVTAFAKDLSVTTIRELVTTEKFTTTHGKVLINMKPIDSATINPITELKQTTKKERPTNDTKKDIEDLIEAKIVTKNPLESEEPFNILTEPEHITAVMGEKDTERGSADLISVLGIAGGVMMAVITLASVIVMMERCRKPRYEDIRKINEMNMQVYLDENDVPPPPYVRSIFHTPLPDPPTSEKCHYQPISTLDRNVKQFMRPVVVQTISPIMLENFRGILECHYDHLPLRNNAILCEERIASSAETCEDYDLRVARCLADSTIEALKCEARSESIDSTTSEPLYAEIPCWRPQSEHAIEIVNLNGEAMTEL